MEKEFKILSIDGGGIRGLIPAKVLEELEWELRLIDPNKKLHEHFDLICGTSTGAILAIAIGLGVPASEIVGFYKEHAKSIFPRWYLKFIPQKVIVFIRSIYGNRILRQKLKEVYSRYNQGKAPLLNDVKTKLCIPTFNGGLGEINILKTKHHSDYVRDYKLPAHEVALSSASAPVYFPPNSFEYKNEFGSGANLNMIDGGIFANNPALIGILEAADKLNVRFSRIKVLSLGTGEGKHIIKKSRLPKNFFYWFIPSPRLIDITLNSQSQITEQYIQFLNRVLAKNNDAIKYLRVQHVFGLDSIKLNASSKEELNQLESIGGELAKKQLNNILKLINN